MKTALALLIAFVLGFLCRHMIWSWWEYDVVALDRQFEVIAYAAWWVLFAGYIAWAIHYENHLFDKPRGKRRRDD